MGSKKGNNTTTNSSKARITGIKTGAKTTHLGLGRKRGK